jgi:two-component system, response regulator
MMSEQPIEILLVEDNPDDVELALYALSMHNLANRVHVVRDGAEALEFVFCTGAYAGRRIEETPRVILLDLKLPKIGGVEVLQRIREDTRTRTIPVVILTSSHEDKDILASYNHQANSYIVKPVDFEQFAEAVRQLGFYWVLFNRPPCF